MKEVDVQNGVFIPSIENDLLKIAVIERHHSLGLKGLGIVHGLGLTKVQSPQPLPMIRIMRLLLEQMMKIC